MSASANPYRRLLDLLLAVPEQRQYLLSYRRRGVLTGKRLTCGCLFGTVAPPRARNPRFWATYADEAWITGSAFATWIDGLLGEAAIGIVEELEQLNDNYAAYLNDPDTCARRFAYMVSVLDEKARTWDQQMKGETDEG